MRASLLAIAGLAGIAASQPAKAVTIVVFTNPETLERRMVVVDEDGPDRVFMCMLPPGEAGCHQVPVRRKG
ncbi:MAG: hypothetical protein HOP96_03100 [Sphingomonas sp.]|nr:hypothetical protein [Sphingomonas sp.]